MGGDGVMTDTDLVRLFIATGGGLIVAWAAWISRNVAGAMSREEHKQLCENRDKRVAGDLEEIKQMIRDNAREATNSRNNLSDRVQNLVVDVALLAGRKRTEDDPAEWLR